MGGDGLAALHARVAIKGRDVGPPVSFENLRANWLWGWRPQAYLKINPS